MVEQFSHVHLERALPCNTDRRSTCYRTLLLLLLLLLPCSLSTTPCCKKDGGDGQPSQTHRIQNKTNTRWSSFFFMFSFTSWAYAPATQTSDTQKQVGGGSSGRVNRNKLGIIASLQQKQRRTLLSPLPLPHILAVTTPPFLVPSMHTHYSASAS